LNANAETPGTSAGANLPARTDRSLFPHVVIVGGGFAGLGAARALAGAPVRITLIDRRNHHLFQALLYQVATAALAATDIASPIRSVLRHQSNVAVRLAEVTSVDLASRCVVMGNERFGYDYLILAAGAGQSYFGHDEWAPLAPGSEESGRRARNPPSRPLGVRSGGASA
jgi:NADH dehydrogenase FAD-containing subunit